MTPTATQDFALCSYLVDTGLLAPAVCSKVGAQNGLLCLESFGVEVVGAGYRALERILLRRPSSHSDSDVSLITWLAKHVPVRRFNSRLMETLSIALADRVRIWPRADLAKTISEQNDDVRILLLWTCFVLYEVRSPILHPFHDSVNGVLGMETFRRILCTRDRKLGVKDTWPGESPFKRDEVRRLLGPYGMWATRWVNGGALIDGQAP